MKRDVAGCVKEDLPFHGMIFISMDIVLSKKQRHFESK
jgi:hypothetical protein